MRQGQNPAKMGLPAYQPKKLGLALLSCIPSQDGYFSRSLEILKYQIASIHHSTKDFDLLVFDNGSCREVQDELRCLQTSGLIHFLMLSQFNIGKTGALNWILSSIPNEFIGYADGDVLFRPGWVEKSFDIMQAFPASGLITAQPCLFDILRGTGQAHLSLANEDRYHLVDHYLDLATVEEYRRGIGLTQEEQIEITEKMPVHVVEERKTGMRAVIGASHMQFIMPRGVARRVIPLPHSFALNRDNDVVLDRNIDQAGFLHLSTLEAYVYHMGNQLDEYTLDEIQRLGLDEILNEPASVKSVSSAASLSPAKRRAFRIFSMLVHWPVFRNLGRRLYNFLFEFFAQEK